jgi:hypothetical protein
MVRALLTYYICTWGYPNAGDTKPVRAMITASISGSFRFRMPPTIWPSNFNYPLGHGSYQGKFSFIRSIPLLYGIYPDQEAVSVELEVRWDCTGGDGVSVGAGQGGVQDGVLGFFYWRVSARAASAATSAASARRDSSANCSDRRAITLTPFLCACRLAVKARSPPCWRAAWPWRRAAGARRVVRRSP